MKKYNYETALKYVYVALEYNPESLVRRISKFFFLVHVIRYDTTNYKPLMDSYLLECPFYGCEGTYVIGKLDRSNEISRTGM